MLVNSNEVYTFKLVSGEELIAKVLQKDNNLIFIQEPVSIAPGPQGMGLIPSLFTVSDKTEPVTLNTACISMYAKTDDAVKLKYLEATTGITVPEKKIVFG